MAELILRSCSRLYRYGVMPFGNGPVDRIADASRSRDSASCLSCPIIRFCGVSGHVAGACEWETSSDPPDLPPVENNTDRPAVGFSVKYWAMAATSVVTGSFASCPNRTVAVGLPELSAWFAAMATATMLRASH